MRINPEFERRGGVYVLQLPRYSSKKTFSKSNDSSKPNRRVADDDSSYLKLHPKFIKPSIKLPSICLPLSSQDSPLCLNKNSSRRKHVSQRPRFKTDPSSQEAVIRGIESEPFGLLSFPKNRQQNSYRFLPQFVQEQKRFYKQDEIAAIFPHIAQKQRAYRKVINIQQPDIIEEQKDIRRSRKLNLSNFISKVNSRADISDKSRIGENGSAREIASTREFVLVGQNTQRRLPARVNDIQPWETEKEEDEVV